MHLTGFILVLKGSGHEHCWLLFCLVIISGLSVPEQAAGVGG